MFNIINALSTEIKDEFGSASHKLIGTHELVNIYKTDSTVMDLRDVQQYVAKWKLAKSRGEVCQCMVKVFIHVNEHEELVFDISNSIAFFNNGEEVDNFYDEKDLYFDKWEGFDHALKIVQKEVAKTCKVARKAMGSTW